MKRPLMALASLFTTGFIVACMGGSTDSPSAAVEGQPLAPVPTSPVPMATEVPPSPPPTEPSAYPTPKTAAAGSLLVLRPVAEGCEFVLVTLPSLAERVLSPSPCAEALFIETTGARVLVDNHLVDLKTGVIVPLKAPEESGELFRSELRFSPSGEVILLTSTGIGEPVWMEGPSYQAWTETVFAWGDGAWVERGSVVNGGAGESSESQREAFRPLSAVSGTRLSPDWEGPYGKWVPPGALRDALDAVNESDFPGDWSISESVPILAVRSEQAGEGSELEGPPLISVDGTWVPLEFEGRVRALSRDGDWAMALTAGWGLADLTLGKLVAEGQGNAWFWPKELPLPPAATE